MSNELDSLIEKRRVEVEAEKAKAAEAQRREREAQQRYSTDLQNFAQSVVGAVANIATMKAVKLRGVGKLAVDTPKPDRVQLAFAPERAPGSGLLVQTMTLNLDRAGNVSWESAFVSPGSVPLAEMTHQRIDHLVDAFLTGALR